MKLNWNYQRSGGGGGGGAYQKSLLWGYRYFLESHITMLKHVSSTLITKLKLKF